MLYFGRLDMGAVYKIQDLFLWNEQIKRLHVIIFYEQSIQVEAKAVLPYPLFSFNLQFSLMGTPLWRFS